MLQETEGTLICRALKGDQRAFSTLFRAYHPWVYAVILRRMADRDEAEDLAQMTFMRAFRALGSFRGDAAFSTWLTRIALNVCNTHLHARCLRQSWMETLACACSGPPSGWGMGDEGDPERAVCRKELQQIVRRGIRALPAPYRQAMWLRCVEEQSYAEIRRELGVPMGTVKTWLCRARRRLKGEFQKAETWAM